MSTQQEDKTTVKCKKLHNEALDNLYLSDKITDTESRITRWAGHITHRGIKEMGKKFCPKTLGVKAILIDLSTHRRKYSMGFRETGSGGVDCIHLPQNRISLQTFVNTVMTLYVPQN
jgi:hypothetical protein